MDEALADGGSSVDAASRPLLLAPATQQGRREGRSVPMAARRTRRSEEERETWMGGRGGGIGICLLH